MSPHDSIPDAYTPTVGGSENQTTIPFVDNTIKLKAASRSQATPAMTLSLKDWIEIASSSISKEDYINCAVTIALELVNRLCRVVGIDSTVNHDRLNSSLSSHNDSANIEFDLFSSLRIQDVVVENVVVSLATNGVNNGTSCAHFMAAQVNIQPGSASGDFFENPQLAERDVCYALGRILFELFSQNDPFVLEIGPIDETFEDEDSFTDLLLGDIEITAPAPKRSSMSAQNAIKADLPTRSKAILQEQGLPFSICHLISDLLEAYSGNAFVPDTALLHLDEVRRDLNFMKTDPQRFLFDQTSPLLALSRTELFNQTDTELIGREKEIGTLMEKASTISWHSSKRAEVMQTSDFLCEAIFLSGHSGAGKSRIMRELMMHCNANNWFVITCKFDRLAAPLSALLQAFDDFFGNFEIELENPNSNHEKMEPPLEEAFDRISQSIAASADRESFGQLCELVPNLSPMVIYYNRRRKVQNRDTVDLFENLDNKSRTASISSSGGVGSGSNRLNYLFHIIFKAVCSGGHPVTIALDDLQWSGSIMDIIRDLVQSSGYNSSISGEQVLSRGGLLLVGTFRDNEVADDGFLMKQIKCMELHENLNVTQLFVGELQDHDLNKMLSYMFCLPMRYTRELAYLVHAKTRGHPLYTVEFLRSIIQKDLMLFSVKERRWLWDDSLDLQMISEGVVALLTRKLRQLPHNVIETLKIASCFGQMNASTIHILDQGHFVTDMQKSLEVALNEGILEKAGPIFAFSHDMLQESTYNLIAVDERTSLHKKIGICLAHLQGIYDNAELSALAVDQINKCKNADGVLNPVEQVLFARLNLAAGKHATAASSYEQAYGYFEAGISLLNDNAWVKQYSLCLELYEMSVAVSFMNGKLETVSSRLDIILSQARTFEDAMNSWAFRAKLLASQEQHALAKKELLEILSKLGEEFPNDYSLAHVSSQICTIQSLLKETTKETIINLPTMTDIRKLNAMRFMGLLITLSTYSTPMLTPLLASRMITLSLDYGFCQDTISGLAFMSHALVHYSTDFQLATQIGRIAESLINDNQNQHSLRARLTQLMCTIKIFFEPGQACVEFCLNGYNSAKIVGDVDNAMLCGMIYCISYFVSMPDLECLQRSLVTLMPQISRNKRISILRSAMSYFNTATFLIGNEKNCSIDANIEMKTNIELSEIAEQTQNTLLLVHSMTNQIWVHCFFREYVHVSNLAEKYRICTGMSTGTKRGFDVFFWFHVGLSALCLARDTKQEKWREIGEESVKVLAQYLELSVWNFENKHMLLQAELQYLKKRHALAILSYQAAIESAREHKFYHEEGLGHELYGIYLIENEKIENGLSQLQLAIESYKKWGAIRKADDVKDFIELIDQQVNFW
eukprot:CAMPEP_0183748936 /NCGR_PEP_ID=MMETSP0737-20130205/68026_1 /TAXON_ID=385413 /ORGANISM="Thalassiosira miniscula, Strain CCMP1093" /LENGTH=1365 /DNA_ID=CAMNT_0025984679 /DNA_START=116 /DNA_END=4210 /DNA_ORIENTATION=+